VLCVRRGSHCHLVAADGADAAVVPGDGLRGAVEGMLQDAGRDENAVDFARVVRVHIRC
jgi:hypothetical protein